MTALRMRAARLPVVAHVMEVARTEVLIADDNNVMAAPAEEMKFARAQAVNEP